MLNNYSARRTADGRNIGFSAKRASHFEQERPNLAGEHQLGPAITDGRFVDIWAESAGPIWYEGMSSSVVRARVTVICVLSAYAV